MWIAKTTFSDAVAGILLATALFLILFGMVTLVKWILLLISGKPNPAKMENVVLTLEYKCEEDQDEEEDKEESEQIRHFALYLQSKIMEKKAGHLSQAYQANDELFLRFTGSDATRIWNLLITEIEAYSPVRPQSAILERTKKNGGTRMIDQIAWRPAQKLDFRPPPEVAIPEVWRRLSGYGRVLSIAGFSGLIGWRVVRMSLGQTENEFMDTGLGMLLAYLAGAILVTGLSLGLICSIRFRTISKTSGFPNPYADSPASDTLKYVVLIVIAIFGLILGLI